MAKLTLKLSGGSALKMHLSRLTAKVGKQQVLRVGFLENATYPDGTSVASVAFFNEFGTSKSPPRPFFRNMIAEKSPEWGTALAAIMRAKGVEPGKVLELMGEGIKGQLVQSIRDFSTPALAPSTVAAKGFAKPLIDTGVMIRSVGHEVSDE